MYAKCFKRMTDFTLSLIAILVLSPVLLILIIVGAIAMRGNPFFVQPRPGKKDKDREEKIFKLVKFRTMDNRKDKDGNPLPDDMRLNKYGRILRSTSLDGNVIIGQTTESLVNKGFREVSPNHFLKGRDLFSQSYNGFHLGGVDMLVA